VDDNSYDRTVGRALCVLLVIAACERADAPAHAPAGAVSVPPALPGEPAIGADRERMLQQFADNISHGVYTHANLMFLLCNCEAGKSAAHLSGDPFSIALMRRMVALFRAAPGMANATCPPSASP
jgi:hypothetical protein